MVKSKKMSKTSIAVIILALLLVLSMVLGLTGAWFTQKSAASSTASNSLVFGGIGNATITATGVEHSRDDGSGNYVACASGTKVMPGDKVTAGGVTIAHAAGTGDTANTESKLYFLIAYNGGSGVAYYITSVSDQDADGMIEGADVMSTDVLVAASDEAQELKAGESLVIPGQIMSIKIDNKWYELDGVHSGSATAASGSNQPGSLDNRYHSWEIPTSERGHALNSYDAKVGVVDYNKNGVSYTVAIMQTTNATAQQAYLELVSVLSA